MVGVNVQDAPRFGVIVSNNSQGGVDNALIKGAGSNGLIAANSAVMFITNTIVEDGQTGIQANRGSHIRIGQDSAGSSTLGPVVVRNNRGSGINIDSSAAAIIVATTVEDNLGSGINITRSAHADIGIGSFNVLGAVTVRNNSTSGSGNGIFVDGGSINLVGSTISGHAFGLQMVNGANGRVGILPDSTAYLGNTITGNRGHGILLSFGATALIGGNTISGNGVAAPKGPALGPGSRSGVFISQASANFIGHNTIENHPDSGIFMRQGQLFLGNGWAALDTTGNLIQNNGCGQRRRAIARASSCSMVRPGRFVTRPLPEIAASTCSSSWVACSTSAPRQHQQRRPDSGHGHSWRDPRHAPWNSDHRKDRTGDDHCRQPR